VQHLNTLPVLNSLFQTREELDIKSDEYSKCKIYRSVILTKHKHACFNVFVISKCFHVSRTMFYFMFTCTSSHFHYSSSLFLTPSLHFLLRKYYSRVNAVPLYRKFSTSTKHKESGVNRLVSLFNMYIRKATFFFNISTSERA